MSYYQLPKLSSHFHFAFLISHKIFPAIINEDSVDGGMANGRSMDSLRSSYTNSSSNSELDTDINPDDKEEKARLISQVLELQNTLDGKLDCCFLYCWSDLYDESKTNNSF